MNSHDLEFYALHIYELIPLKEQVVMPVGDRAAEWICDTLVRESGFTTSGGGYGVTLVHFPSVEAALVGRAACALRLASVVEYREVPCPSKHRGISMVRKDANAPNGELVDTPCISCGGSLHLWTIRGSVPMLSDEELLEQYADTAGAHYLGRREPSI